MSSGKSGKQTSKIELPKSVTNQAKENMKLANEVGSLPYAPFFGGSVAAFQPAQMAGFDSMNKAADAFGLQGKAGAGLPKAQNFGGVSGYSTEAPYKAAMAQVDPKVLELYNSFFYPNKRAAAGGAAQQPSMVSGGNQMQLMDEFGNTFYAMPQQGKSSGAKAFK